ncbi:MAG: fibrobacter succinogenes major paralogous domain-containing protein [Bacteroidales bacterium]|nr:fibrobacter succinogenes major paralogous domain-containing protein [Bacteroidales bacterium]
MKTIIYSYLISLILLLGVARAASSQIIEVCGADTITLMAGNYQYGDMRWEKSVDMETWQTITGALDTVYTFLPAETMYYRCVAKFQDCPPEFSQISLVRVPPKANAGLDRIVTGTQAWLAANQEEGETGQWAIIAGTGASLSDPASPSAQLQGQENQSYILVWTLGNVCGSSSDTLEVEFVTNQYFDNFVVVDTTDIILSTNEQLADGEYIIRFSSPVPAVADSTVLVGIQLGGFLRMVQSVSINTAGNDTIHTMQTTQAALDDITEYGAYNFGEFFSLDTTLSAAKNGGYNRLTRMPTRQELKGNQKYRNAEIHYYLIGEKASMPKGVTMNRSTSKSGSALVNFNFESVEIVDTMGVTIVLEGNYSYRPNLVVDRKSGWLGNINYFKLGTSNSREELSVSLSVDINATVSLLDKEFTIYEHTLYYLVIVGAVPVLLDIEFALKGKAGAEAGIMMNATPSFQQTNTTSNYIEYSNGSWGITNDFSSETDIENSYEITGGLKQTFEIGPELSFNIYKILGPYLDIKLNQELLLCTSLPPPPFGWAVKNDIWGLGKLGVKGSVFGKEFIDFYTLLGTDTLKYNFPDSLEITMGDQQTYKPGARPQERQIPVQVKVHSNMGISLPGAKVVFTPQSTCSVGDNPPDSILVVYADANGIANTIWTPGNYPESILLAHVLDCDSNHIKNSPLEIIAYADTTKLCGKIWMTFNLDVDMGNNWWPQQKYCVDWSLDQGNFGSCLQYEWQEHTEYGRLYDWATIMNGESSSNSNPSGVQGICPSGWHLPSDAEWQQLVNCMGGIYVAGSKLKSTRTGEKLQVGHYTYNNPDGHPFWYTPNTGATNESGFSALPGGKYDNGSFYDFTIYGYWWSSTEGSSSTAWAQRMNHGGGVVYRVAATKLLGYSVRCVKNDD